MKNIEQTADVLVSKFVGIIIFFIAKTNTSTLPHLIVMLLKANRCEKKQRKKILKNKKKATTTSFTSMRLQNHANDFLVLVNIHLTALNMSFGLKSHAFAAPNEVSTNLFRTVLLRTVKKHTHTHTRDPKKKKE